EVVLYSGNTAKEMIHGVDGFLGAHRLWLAQYSPSRSVQQRWSGFWLWQFTDGVNGPSPHAIDGIGPCDINSFDGGAAALIAQWATGRADPLPPPPHPEISLVTVLVATAPGVD